MQNTKPLSPEGRVVDTFSTANVTLLCNLYDRWQNEKQYEDIKDYALPLQTSAKENGLVIKKMNKRPFGCDVQINNKTFRVFVTSKAAGWKQIPN